MSPKVVWGGAGKKRSCSQLTKARAMPLPDDAFKIVMRGGSPPTLIAPWRRPSSALPRSACVGDHHCHGAVVVLEVALSFPSCHVVLKTTLAAVTPIASAVVLDK